MLWTKDDVNNWLTLGFLKLKAPIRDKTISSPSKMAGVFPATDEVRQQPPFFLFTKCRRFQEKQFWEQGEHGK
jgi:hypothetical protein